MEVLGAAKGRVYAEDELARCVSQALFPRTTNRYGCVTLHSYHFDVEAGLPQTQVLLWVAGEQLRAVCESVLLAEHHCRYDWQDRHVKDIREGMRYQTRSPEPEERAQRWRRRRPPPRGSQGASAGAVVRRGAGATGPDRARSSPHDREGATLVAPATGVAAAC